MASDDPAVPETLPRVVPALLSFIAGYVDSCTFLALFGLYVAQLTGSFVLVGTETVVHDSGAVTKLLAIPVFGIAGAAATVLVRASRVRAALPATLALEAALLAGLLVSWRVGAPLTGRGDPAVIFASLFGLSAMGVQSALVRLLAKGCPSTNVMTTNTTLFAVDATDLVIAWRAHRRAPGDAAAAAAYGQVRDRFALLWPIVLGFVVGTVGGAAAYARIDLWCLLLAVAVVGALAVWASRRGSA